MNINISNYIESLLNSNGRFQNIEKLYVIKDQRGEPIIRVSPNWVEFEVDIDQERHLLKCLSSSDYSVRSASQTAITYATVIASPYLLPVEYFEQEMVVFDNMGQPQFVDVVVQAKPSGVSLSSYVRENQPKGDKQKLKTLVYKLSELSNWLRENNFAHGKISPLNIYVAPKGDIKLSDYSSIERTVPITDLHTIGNICVILYLSLCESKFYNFLGESALVSKETVAESVAIVKHDLDKDFPPSLKELISTLSDLNCSSMYDPTKIAEEVCEKIDALAKSNPQPIPSLAKFINERFGTSKVNKFHFVGASSLYDRLKQYKFVAQMNEMLIRAWDGEWWLYLDKNGEVVIEGDFIDVTDFDEGLAVVELESGYGLIDHDGKFVIEPKYHDIEWNSAGNIVFATLEGYTGLFSREGEAITELIYDRILEVSEGLIVAQKEKQYGFISRSGETVIPFIYDDAYSFRNGVAKVTIGNRDFIIDSDGNEVI